MNYPEALSWLYATQGHGIKLGLDRVRSFLADLGWHPGSTRFLHVAGTNGKGSVCAMLDAICRAARLRTGLFTSPHLVTFRERIRIDGQPTAREEIARELTRIRAICERAQSHPTFFEITTVLALCLFQRASLDVVVLETGLGGRLDSTNIIHPVATAITSIGMDHMQFLGDTLAQIAREKAGIIKPGVPVITTSLDPCAAAVVEEVSAGQNAPLFVVTDPLPSIPVSLKGSHQLINAAIAAKMLQEAGLPIGSDALAHGLAALDWPARFQDTKRGFVLDGAHNPEAARRLVKTWHEEYGDRLTAIILGVVRDKDARGICEALAPIATRFTIVPVPGPRGGGTDDVLAIATALRPSRAFPSLKQAIDSELHVQEAPVLITGSLFLMGEALVALGLSGDEQELSAQ